MKITYTNKEALIDDEEIPVINKVTAGDLNEIKNVVNNNADELDIAKGNIDILQSRVSTNETDISDIKTEQTTQNNNIQTNANNIETIAGRVGTNETDISNVKTEQNAQNSRLSSLESDNTTNKTNISNLQSGKVDKVSGKGLTTNDYDNTEKTKNETNRTDILLRALITETGNKIALEINSSTFVLTAKLYDKNNNLIHTSNGIDLPIESMIVNASYSDGTLTLTLQNGQTLDVDISSIISGLQQEITSENKLESDLVDDTNQTNKFVTAGEKSTWNSKYTKPSGGIPKTDLSESVQTSLNKADTAIQDISGKEDKSNKVTSISNESTDTEYPSAKCVYDSQENQDSLIEELQEENERLRNDLNNSTLTVPGTGENVTLENTTDARFKKFGVSGNKKQETREGYNLLDIRTEVDGNTLGLVHKREGDKIKLTGTVAQNGWIGIGLQFTLPVRNIYIFLYKFWNSSTKTTYFKSF